MVDHSKFKNIQGRLILKPLFFELDDAEHSFSVYTLKAEDHTFNGITYPSLRRLYIETEDPTEYLFATEHLYSWSHWKDLIQCGWFQPHLREWREELEVRLRAKALLRMKARAEGDTKDSMQADKLLIAGGWKTEEEKTRGRPSKQKIIEEAEKLFSADKDVDEDHARLFGTIN